MDGFARMRPPTPTLPHEGGGDRVEAVGQVSPSPLMGEGWGGGDFGPYSAFRRSA